MVERQKPVSFEEFNKKSKLASDINSLQGQRDRALDPKEIKRLDDLIRRKLLQSTSDRPK